MIEGDTSKDDGCCIRDGIKAAVQFGAPSEELWAFDTSKITTRPSTEAFAAGLKDVVLTYSSVPQNFENIVSCLRHREPVIFGSSLFKDFETEAVSRTGIVPMPKGSEQPTGGHCMVIVGTNPSEKRFIVRNHWGPNWGMQGYCEMPYDYILNHDLTCDLWVVNMVKKYY
jgi:hypothetical protein